MKTYVLFVSTKFPGTHPRKGENTLFLEQILEEVKIHTIRSNYSLWAKRIDKIKNGEACLSIRYWEGRPYHSAQPEAFRMTAEHGVDYQKIKMNKDFSFTIDGKEYSKDSLDLLSRNDGLSRRDFEDWFTGYDLTKELIIIHFTFYRYGLGV